MQHELFIKVPISDNRTTTINVSHIINIESGFEDKARLILSGSIQVNTNLGYDQFLEALGRIKAGAINVIKIRTIS